MKLSYSPYNLTPRQTLNAHAGRARRSGALVRVQWEDGRIGYGDLFPWPEWGDGTVKEELQRLSDNPTPLGQITLRNARLDAEARARGESLFTSVVVPRSHYLIAEGANLSLADLKARGFAALKLKLMGEPTRMASRVNELARQCEGQWRLRLDANGAYNFADFKTLAESLRCSDVIEFCEDPTLFAADQWRLLSNMLPLAADHQWHPSWLQAPFYALIHKPARQERRKVVSWLRQHPSVKAVVTTSMDHPVGQCFAAYHAAHLNQELPGQMLECGLQTYDIYESNSYFECLGLSRAEFSPPRGYGIGFDDLLEAEPWQTLH